MIPYQKNIGGIVAILPDGRVEFLHLSAKKLIDDINSGKRDASSINFDDYILYDPVVDLNRFHLNAPLIGFIETTNLCNLRCKHCYASSGYKRKHEMDRDVIIDLIDQFEDMGVLQVFLTGGEVFAHPNALEFIQHAMTKSFSTQIFTNGLLITEEKLAAIPPGCSFFISFDTADPERTIRGKMDFPKLRNCFEWMKKHGHVFRTAFSAHSGNIHDAVEIFKWCAENGYPRPQWLETHPVGRALIHKDILLTPDRLEEAFEIYVKCMELYMEESPEEESPSIHQTRLTFQQSDNTETRRVKITGIQTIKLAQRLERASGQEKCGRTIAYINSQGNVYPCSNCMSGEHFLAGNVKEKSFQEIWETGFDTFRSYSFADHTVCNSCPVKAADIWCQFRCPPLSKNLTGELHNCGATDYLRTFMLKTAQYWRESTEKNRELVLQAPRKN